MRVFILGGTGVFGSRLGAMLIEDGHEVLIASRSYIRAHRTCQKIGGTPVMADRNGDLGRILERHRPDVLVDAAGPFQAYSGDPYKVARLALGASAHYLDFSDDAAFCDGIWELDSEALAAGVCVLSGVSSVPALSSAIVTDLAEDLRSIDLIDMAILPGNRAPRGRSVIEAILLQIGQDMSVWVGGRWTRVRCWSQPRTYDLGQGIRRQAALIGAPDLRLFPAHFAAGSVLFRAGLELKVMQRSLSVLSWLRGCGLIPDLARFSRLLHRIAGWLEPFGSDTGGMQVRVTGTDKTGDLAEHVWTLRATDGDGPNIPAIPALHLINAWAKTAPVPGARPCLAEFTRGNIEATLGRLSVSCGRNSGHLTSLFQKALGPDWTALPVEVRTGHSVPGLGVMRGEAQIERGSGLLSRILAAVFRFPQAGRAIPVEVTMETTEHGETWTRDFAGQRFRSYLSSSGLGKFRERFGPFSFEMDLPVTDGVLSMPVRRGWCLGVPMPHWFLPGSETREYALDGRFCFDVRLSAPIAGLLVYYRGWLEPVSGSAVPPLPHAMTSGTDPQPEPSRA